jgi:DNA polymerase-1
MDFLTNSDGLPTGMEFGFLRTLESIQKKLGDREIVVCWDSKRNFKKEKYESYKANRPKKSGEFYGRLDAFKKFVSCVYPVCEHDGYEADDIMGSIASMEAEFEDIYIYSNDKDLLQCVGDGVCMITSHESQLWRWDAEDVVEEFGVTPSQFIFYKVFLGDKVDNIQGIERFPKKLLVKAIQGNHTLQDVLVKLSTLDMGPKTHENLGKFIAEGLAQKNYYDLVKLSEVDYTIKIEKNEEYVKSKLVEWEIGSLEICKDYDFKDAFDNMEF